MEHKAFPATLWLVGARKVSHSVEDKPGPAFSQESALAWLDTQSDKVRSRIAIQPGEDIFSPACKTSGWLAGPALFICTLVRIACKNVLLIPSSGLISRREGCGRSAILLSLLRMVPDYGHYLGFDLESLSEQLWLNARPTVKRHCSLIAADRAYLALGPRGLAAAPIHGEPVDFAWDIARNLFRSLRLDYFPGMHRDPAYRAQLFRLFFHLRLDESALDSYASDWRNAHKVDRIIVLELTESGRDAVDLIEIEPDRRSDEIKRGLKYTATHGSRFWLARREKSREFIGRLEGEASLAAVPLSKLVIEHQGLLLSRKMYTDAAGILSASPGHRPRDDGKVYCAVIRAMTESSNATVIATHRCEMLRDQDFWKAIRLANFARAATLILLPDPDTIGRASEHVVNEMRESIQLVLRMRSLDYALRLGLYRHRPGFQLAVLCGARFFISLRGALEEQPDCGAYCGLIALLVSEAKWL